MNPPKTVSTLFDTSEGEFTAILYFEQVPITVANFVGLAENSISHFHDTTGEAQNKRFYDGITFHRIIENFVIQAGSPNGTGTDGPGYSFADEIEPDLKHNAKGILSMANAGPNTNGSQFFVTLSSETATHLDGRHAVFGLVVDGIEVVDAIGVAPTGTGGAPTNPIIINSVTILRVGEAAEAFSPASFLRPTEVAVEPKIDIGDDGSARVSFPRTATRDYFLYQTSDFQCVKGPTRLLWSAVKPESIEHIFGFPKAEMNLYFTIIQNWGFLGRSRILALRLLSDCPRNRFRFSQGYLGRRFCRNVHIGIQSR